MKLIFSIYQRMIELDRNHQTNLDKTPRTPRAARHRFNSRRSDGGGSDVDPSVSVWEEIY